MMGDIFQRAKALPLSGKLGLALVIFWLAVALFGPMLAPYPVGAFVAYDVFDGQSAKYWLGSDYLGRDVLSRLMSGARYTVGLAAAAALLASTSGTALALTAAVGGAKVDEPLSRFMDMLISIPSKIFSLVLVAAFGSSLGLLLLIAAFTYIPAITGSRGHWPSIWRRWIMCRWRRRAANGASTSRSLKYCPI